jgi:enoyl-CoA hydratase/carnithine racemase
MSDDYKTIQYEVADRVATITINRVERRNALNNQVIEELTSALDKARTSDDVNVLVLTGAGERAFSAGGDLSPGGGMGGGLLAMHWDRGGFADLLLAFRRVGKPIVGRINGDALGGGFGLLLACDIAIASDKARVGCPEINLGLFPMMIMALIFRNVPRKIGVEMMLTGKKWGADKALEHGMVNAVVPADELDAAVTEMVDTLKSKSPAIMRLGLNAFHTMSDMPLEEALRYLHGCLTLNTMAEDAAEGVMAFIQKREAQWKGR